MTIPLPTFVLLAILSLPACLSPAHGQDQAISRPTWEEGRRFTDLDAPGALMRLTGLGNYVMLRLDPTSGDQRISWLLARDLPLIDLLGVVSVAAGLRIEVDGLEVHCSR